MKTTYLIDQIGGVKAIAVAGSIAELERIAIRQQEKNGGSIKRIYVHCNRIYGESKDELNVEYEVRVNNQKRTITTKRIQYVRN